MHVERLSLLASREDRYSAVQIRKKKHNTMASLWERGYLIATVLVLSQMVKGLSFGSRFVNWNKFLIIMSIDFE